MFGSNNFRQLQLDGYAQFMFQAIYIKNVVNFQCFKTRNIFNPTSRQRSNFNKDQITTNFTSMHQNDLELLLKAVVKYVNNCVYVILKNESAPIRHCNLNARVVKHNYTVGKLLSIFHRVQHVDFQFRTIIISHLTIKTMRRVSGSALAAQAQEKVLSCHLNISQLKYSRYLSNIFFLTR